MLSHEGRFGYRQPKFISPLSSGFALHTLEKEDFFRKYVKIVQIRIVSAIKYHSIFIKELNLR